MIIEVCPHCGADLEHLTYTTYPPIHTHICRNCGWQQEERENITRVSIATVNRKKPTNADLIRAMSDEELAKFIELELMKYPWCREDAAVDPITKECLVPHQFCWECVLDWLKEVSK